MDYFNYQGTQLFAENVPIKEIIKQWGTPCYIYSRATLERHWTVFDEAFNGHPHRICYAVKANSNLAILNLLARLGSGFDIVSQGELERVLAARGQANTILFSGVGKLVPEIVRALEAGIACFNVESSAELYRLNEIAGSLHKKAPISLRVNPDIDANTHPYIATGLRENKFGVDINEAIAFYELVRTLPHLDVKGIGYHIGSQLTEIRPFIEAFDRVYALIKELRGRGFTINHLDIGGGLGVRYSKEESVPAPSEYICELLKRLSHDKLEIIIEPGRAIVANAGILVTRVEYLKLMPHKNFAVVDAAMNDLLRPSLYNAYQEIIPVEPRGLRAQLFDVVGPICETGDFLGKNRLLSIKEQDLLAVRTAGAYGFTMSSNYNSRRRIPEILVDKDVVHLIRRRETYEDLFRHEQLLAHNEQEICL
jgi:diaminopimelate decarboxylase